MLHHEHKNCERCGIAFECKAENIMQCDCYTVVLTTEQRAYLEKKFTDCICVNCLKELQAEYIEHNKKG